MNVTENGNITSFSSTIFGNVADNPTSAMNLTQEQEDKAVLFFYENISTFKVSLCIGGPPNGFGRNLIFGGVSSILDSPPPPSPPPAPTMPAMGFPPPPGAMMISKCEYASSLENE